MCAVIWTVDEEGERISIKKQTEQTYVFAEGLKEGVHTVRIMKMTQQRTGGNSYSLVVTGVETGTNCRILEQGEENEEKLKIDFYGDSITAGEGNCSDTKEDAITVKKFGRDADVCLIYGAGARF